jgi:hypothetical protein
MLYARSWPSPRAYRAILRTGGGVRAADYRAAASCQAQNESAQQFLLLLAIAVQARLVTGPLAHRHHN